MAALPRTAIDRIAGKDHEIWRRIAQIISNPRRRVTLNRNAFGEILRDFEVRNLVLRGRRASISRTSRSWPPRSRPQQRLIAGWFRSAPVSGPEIGWSRRSPYVS